MFGVQVRDHGWVGMGGLLGQWQGIQSSGGVQEMFWAKSTGYGLCSVRKRVERLSLFSALGDSREGDADHKDGETVCIDADIIQKGY